MMELDAENAEADIETYVVHYEYTDTGGEVQSRGDGIRAGVAQLTVIVALESRGAGAESKVYVVEDSEAAVAPQANVVSVEHGAGIALLVIAHILEGEVDIIVEIHRHVRQVEIPAGVDELESDRLVVAEEICNRRLD